MARPCVEYDAVIIGVGLLVAVAVGKPPIIWRYMQRTGLRHDDDISIIAHPDRGLVGPDKSRYGLVVIVI
jgi:hypothetical protein